MIKAEIIAHSKRRITGEELITFKLTYPRIILSENNVHKMVSKNTSSSRAIKPEKMLEVIKNNPFIPYAWQKEHTGMQGYEYFEESYDIEGNIRAWLEARDEAIKIAELLLKTGNSKQNINRLLEPFMWVTQVVTGTKESFENLFDLRCPNYNGCKSWKELCDLDSNYTMETPLLERLKINKSTAEIHFSILAEMMYDELNNSKPIIKEGNDWHIPFIEIVED